ncbi:MAG: M55 family metallopeptidase, partial [Anaerolineaceae bacterium]
IVRMKINDQYTSEFLLHTYAAATVNVPVVMVSGDAGLCDEVTSFNPHILTIPVKHGAGNSTTSIHPNLAVDRIREGAQKALEGDLSKCTIDLPKHFSTTITFRDHAKAYRLSFFPGATLVEPHTIEFKADDYFEILRLLAFLV